MDITQSSAQEMASRWVGYLKDGWELPDLSAIPTEQAGMQDGKQKFNQEWRDYLAFRRFCRRCSVNGLFQFFKLYGGNEASTIKVWLERCIEDDWVMLGEIEGISDVLSLEEQQYQRVMSMAGRLLYSFSDRVRQEARDLLVGWFYPMLPSYSDNEYSSEAQMVLMKAAENHDVYHHFWQGETKFSDFKRYLLHCLAHVRQRVYWQRFPAHLRRQLLLLSQFEREYTKNNGGGMPSYEETGEALKLNVSEVLTLKETYNTYFPKSLDGEWWEGEDGLYHRLFVEGFEEEFEFDASEQVGLSLSLVGESLKEGAEFPFASVDLSAPTISIRDADRYNGGFSSHRAKPRAGMKGEVALMMGVLGASLRVERGLEMGL
jgi:hypothetical protein